MPSLVADPGQKDVWNDPHALEHHAILLVLGGTGAIPVAAQEIYAHMHSMCQTCCMYMCNCTCCAFTCSASMYGMRKSLHGAGHDSVQHVVVL